MTVAVAATIVALSFSAVTPTAPGAIATLDTETPISAGGGWLLWSVPVPGGWGLEAYHRGVVRALTVTPRPQPFDISVGSDLRGAPVATYSRCAKTPRMDDVGETSVTGGMLLQPQTGSRCRIHVLDLASGRERAIPIPGPRNSSDTTPSMWLGSVAFARKAPGHGDIWQVMLWSPRHPRDVRTLRHGAIPKECERTKACGVECRPPGECELRGTVEALDRSADVVAFVWEVISPHHIHAYWEARVDDLATGHSRLVASGSGHEVCTGGQGPFSEGLELPIASHQEALFSELDSYGSCFSGFATTVWSLTPREVRPREGQLKGAETVLALAKDGNALYGLAAPYNREVSEDAPACTTQTPCTLKRIAEPALTSARFTPTQPFEESIP